MLFSTCLNNSTTLTPFSYIITFYVSQKWDLSKQLQKFNLLYVIVLNYYKKICKITNTVSCRFSNNSLINNSIYY